MYKVFPDIIDIYMNTYTYVYVFKLQRLLSL